MYSTGSTRSSLAVAYRYQGNEVTIPPSGADNLADCEPVYIEMPGWQQSTVGIKDFDQLPQQAIDYLRRLEEFCEVPIDIVSTGPERTETIVLRHPFGD